MRRFRILLLIITTILLLAALSVYFSNRVIKKATAGRLYTNAEELPYNRVGLLLGTSKRLASGAINPYYQYRINAAVTVLKSGRIKYLVISGDNGTKEYNEPEDMRADLIRSGIDSTLLFSDYAGFRTFDSVVRLKLVFGEDHVTIISQPFHNERAVYIARRENMQAIAFNAEDVEGKQGIKVQWREKLARVKVFIDYLLHKNPRFLGKKIVIPE